MDWAILMGGMILAKSECHGAQTCHYHPVSQKELSQYTTRSTMSELSNGSSLEIDSSPRRRVFRQLYKTIAE